MPRRGENIYKRKDGRWEGRYICAYRENGRAKYASVYGKTYGQVKDKLTASKALQRKKPQSSCPLTVNELMDLWLLDRGEKVKDSSYYNYIALTNRHIRPRLGTVLVRTLSAQKLEKYLSDIRYHGRKDGKGGLSPKTVSDVLFVVKSALKLAIRKFGYTDSDGIMEVKAPAVVRRKIETFGEFETKRISDALLKNWNLKNAGIFLCLNTGIRLGELCGLRWGDVNLNENTLKIARTVQRIHLGKGTKMIVQTPKSISSERVIPLHPKLIRMLQELRGQEQDNDYILSRSSKPLDPRTVQYRFCSFLKRENIEKRNFHVLRHSFATRCIEKGMDVKALSEILGHSNVKTTMQLYVHPSMSQKRQYMQAVSTAKFA